MSGVSSVTSNMVSAKTGHVRHSLLYLDRSNSGAKGIFSKAFGEVKLQNYGILYHRINPNNYRGDNLRHNIDLVNT